MKQTKISHLNFGHLLEKESEVKKLTEESFKLPLKTLDESTKVFMKSLNHALSLHKNTKDKVLKDYCTFYLTTGNAILHLVRSSRLALMSGYYGTIAVLMRTFINYLRVSIYIHHYPKDALLLLKEQGDTFDTNKAFKKKFHEFNLKKELKNLGYNMPDEENKFAKLTHGTVWGAQVFGFKNFKMEEGVYELHYSSEFSILQSTTYLSFLLVIPLDFVMYYLNHLDDLGINTKSLRKQYTNTENEIKRAVNAIETSHQFIKNTPDEIQQAILKRL